MNLGYERNRFTGKHRIMKKIWLSSLVSSEEMVKKIMSQMKTYGLEVNGHFWKDDLEKMAWMDARDELLDSEIALWAILASEADLVVSSKRYGLSLLAVTLQAQRGHHFPTVVLQTQGDSISSDRLPTPLKGADVLPASDAGLGAKLVARVHTAGKEIPSEYRLDVYGSPQIGQWFEVGPRNIGWTGVLFGVSGAQIVLHAVGPKGTLPDKSVLRYPVKGLEIGLGEKKYTAWGVQNELNAESSYFTKVEGFPDSIVFGPYATEEAADMYVVEMK